MRRERERERERKREREREKGREEKRFWKGFSIWQIEILRLEVVEALRQIDQNQRDVNCLLFTSPSLHPSLSPSFSPSPFCEDMLGGDFREYLQRKLKSRNRRKNIEQLYAKLYGYIGVQLGGGGCSRSPRGWSLTDNTRQIL